jgi:hypothetical protein
MMVLDDRRNLRQWLKEPEQGKACPGMTVRVVDLKPERIFSFLQGKGADVMQGAGEHKGLLLRQGQSHLCRDTVSDIGNLPMVIYHRGIDKVHGIRKADDQIDQFYPLSLLHGPSLSSPV